MEANSIIYLLFLLLLAAWPAWTCIYVLMTSNLRGKPGRLPPGPRPFPIIGNILELGSKPHQSFARLSKIYGPLMSLKLGNVTAIVVSSPTLARQVLQKYDQVLSNRVIPRAAQVLDNHKFSMVWLPVSSAWRNLRKICKEEMFSLQKLDASHGLRCEKLQELRDYVHKCSINNEAVKIGEVAFTTVLNILSRTLFSVDFAQFESNHSQQLKETVWLLLKHIGTPNPFDYFPFPKLLDPYMHRSKSCFLRLHAIFDDIIHQRLTGRNASSYSFSTRKNDLLDALLDYNMKNESEFSSNNLKCLLTDLFVAGTDTSSHSVEWAMTELIRNPDKMAKSRAELKEVLGEKEQIQESDISSLPYLQAVIKETFRLHPPAPLLVPHKAEADAEINGYTVPKNAHIFVNVWATGRDSGIWSDAETFLPERFLDSQIDVRGQHFELIPFSSGRRICPGLPLGYLMVHLMLATLIHNLDWKLDDGMKPGDLDMEEVFGITVQKAVPLKAIPVKL